MNERECWQRLYGDPYEMTWGQVPHYSFDIIFIAAYRAVMPNLRSSLFDGARITNIRTVK